MAGAAYSGFRPPIPVMPPGIPRQAPNLSPWLAAMLQRRGYGGMAPGFTNPVLTDGPVQRPAAYNPMWGSLIGGRLMDLPSVPTSRTPATGRGVLRM